MADFNLAVAYVLNHEGGYSRDGSDPGGETNFGISKRSYPDVDVAALTEEGAKAIYHRDFWHPLFDQIVYQPLATKLLDLSVNMGQGAAINLLQQAVSELGRRIEADGDFGPVTLSECNLNPPEAILSLLKAKAAERYVRICQGKESSKKYLFGWLKRLFA